MSRPAALVRLAMLLAALACVAIVVLVGLIGARATLAQVSGGLSALPAALFIHLAELFVGALGWRALLPHPIHPMRMFRARWIREAVNSMLPVANLGGAVIGARMLTHDGIDAATAGASVTADITGEVISQILFILAALCVMATIPHTPVSGPRLLLVLGPLVAVFSGLLLAQALGLLHWVERLATRLLPRRLSGSLRGLQGRLADIYAQPGRLAADIAGNFAGWSLGALEVWVLLHAVNQSVSLRESYVIESLGLVARSLAFAIPGGLAAQETGFVLACALFGIPHQSGLALSLLKRLRELTVGITGILYWQWLERRVWLAR